MLEILSPVGSPEGVIAAVQNGADAIYLGGGEFNARINAKNFTQEELANATEYCRIRGVKTYLTLNTLVSDNELPRIAEQAKIASRLGVDAIIAQDVGAVLVMRQSVPDVPIHASTQMSIHNLEGVKMAAAMGIKRVVLARELTRREIGYIAERSPIETEVFVHGALCMCYSGQCYMSGVIGRRSGNRGLCAGPCRLDYTTGGHQSEYLLSLKDNCLVEYLQELDEMGVTSVKIEGRMKRPEYSAIVTGIYSKAAKTGKSPSKEELDALRKAFSRNGFTDGFYTRNLGSDIFGVREEDDGSNAAMFATARKNYMQGEFQRVPVWFIGIANEGEPIRIIARDDRKNTAAIDGPVPQPAFHKEITLASLQTQMYKTGGTPFYCAGVKGTIEPGLALPVSAFNEMRRDLLARILELRRKPPERREGTFAIPAHRSGYRDAPVLTVSVMHAKQLSEELLALNPAMVYIPVSELDGKLPIIRTMLENKNITVVASLPRVIHDNERRTISEALTRAKSLGVKEALVGNIGHIQFARGHGFAIRGDYGLNVYNSQTLNVLSGVGLKSAVMSFELRLAQIRDMSKPLDTEIIAYGRLPLMITEPCIIKNSVGTCSCENFSGISDRMGALFPVVREFGCRNIVLNSKKLFLADRLYDTSKLGLWALRLMFTTENARECVSVMKRYMEDSGYEPTGFTRGLYYRGVE